MERGRVSGSVLTTGWLAGVEVRAKFLMARGEGRAREEMVNGIWRNVWSAGCDGEERSAKRKERGGEVRSAGFEGEAECGGVWTKLRNKKKTLE